MKQRIGSLVSALCLCLGLAAPASAAGSPMYIGSAEDLLAFGERIRTEPDTDAVLVADIDLSGVEWEHPLAYDQSYTGALDGGGHTISNLSGRHSFMGILGIGGSIQNLNLLNIEINGVDCQGQGNGATSDFKNVTLPVGRWMGGLVDVGRGDITNCTVSGSITTDAWYAGGIAAEMDGGSIVNCISMVNFTFTSVASSAHCGVGGIAGRISSMPGQEIALVDRCRFGGTISADGAVQVCGYRVAGIVAEPGIYALIINCMNESSIIVNVWKGQYDKPAYVGGITGDTVHTAVINCGNTGTISVTSTGLALGCNGIDGGDDHIGSTVVGGQNCWSSGPVSGQSDVGVAGQSGGATSYFLVGTDMNSVGGPTFTQAELTDGTLVNQLNEYVEQWGDLNSESKLFDSLGLIMRDCCLMAWAQGPDGPVLTNSGTVPAASAQPAGPLAYASTQPVLVDGKAVEFQCYALKDADGNDTNYVKLRDVASVLNGTAAQFAVGWDGAVNILTGQAYTPDGSEMSTPFSGDRAYAVPASETKVNGAAASLAAIVLTDDSGGGFTYYKLRDLGEALGFLVDWSAKKGIFIETE